MRNHRNSSPLARFGLILAFMLPLLAMPIVAPAVRDGNGGFQLPAKGFSNPTTGGTMVASEAEAVWTDIETAIAGSLATDGQSTMSGNIKMGGNKLTELTTGSARTDSLTLGQAQDGAFRWGGVAGGTADAQTLSLPPNIRFRTPLGNWRGFLRDKECFGRRGQSSKALDVLALREGLR